MKKVWREIVIELTPDEEPIWEEAVNKFWQQTAASAEFYDCPISPPEKGKARLPFDADIILELTTHLQALDDVDPKICREISWKLADLYAREK